MRITVQPEALDPGRAAGLYRVYPGGNDCDGALVSVPIEFVVCTRCHGWGQHLDDRFVGVVDCNTLDIGEQVEYESGKWHVTCTRCEGRRVEARVEEDRTPRSILEQLQARERALEELKKVLPEEALREMDPWKDDTYELFQLQALTERSGETSEMQIPDPEQDTP